MPFFSSPPNTTTATTTRCTPHAPPPSPPPSPSLPQSQQQQQHVFTHQLRRKVEFLSSVTPRKQDRTEAGGVLACLSERAQIMEEENMGFSVLATFPSLLSRIPRFLGVPSRVFLSCPEKKWRKGLLGNDKRGREGGEVVCCAGLQEAEDVRLPWLRACTGRDHFCNCTLPLLLTP